MDIINIIAKKRDGLELTEEEIEYFISKYTASEITDYQASALIMAIYINGMTDLETYYMTKSMIKSGKTVSFDIAETVVDKHSTGGVGDKLTLILMPIIVAFGFKVGKMSGRGLGITGGTADKLESIPNIDIELEEEKFEELVKKYGFSLITQSREIVMADKKIYALRDTIACTESIPLIASSIMSKKKASGADTILLDVTYGSGAFMKTYSQAQKLKIALEDLGKKLNMNVFSIITSMETPLGYSVGNSLEILETLEFLSDLNSAKNNSRIYDVVIEYLSYLLKEFDKDEIRKKVDKIIEEKTAYNIFLDMVKRQGGDIERFLKDTNKYNNKENAIVLKSDFEGKIKKIDAFHIAKAAFIAGSGRLIKEDKIDYFAGIQLNKLEGEQIKKGDILAYIYLGQNSEKKDISKILEEIKAAYEIIKT